jgi:hypothetical protein
VLDPDDLDSPSEFYGCLNTGVGMSMVDVAVLNDMREWIHRVPIKTVEICGNDGTVHKSWENVNLRLYLHDESGQKVAAIEREFHVVDDLDSQLVIGTDIIVMESMVINLA